MAEKAAGSAKASRFRGLKIEFHKLMWGLIFANVIVFLLVFSMPEAMQAWVFETFSFSGPQALEVWRWFTSLFLHVSASHLFFNMLGLYFFGKALEDDMSPGWFGAAYLVSGLIGSFAYMFTSAMPVVGASGCVFGVMGAAMFINPIKRIHLYIFPLPLGIVAILFVIFESMAVFFQPEAFAEVTSGVANVAHIGGVITGTMFAFFYSPKRAVKGFFVLGFLLLLLVILSPLFALLATFAGFILQAIDLIIGFILYGIASLLSFIWL